MKTLYININGEDVQSTESIEVIGRKEDAIEDSFYIFLGTEILSGSHVRGVSQKNIIRDFQKESPDEFKEIEVQWNDLKEVLLGDNPFGEYRIVLSSEYLHWLRYSKYAEVYEKKFQGQKEATVTIDIEELYEDSVDSIKRKAIRYLRQDDNAVNIDEFVINDEIVSRRSKIVCDLKKQFDIAFCNYAKFEWPHKEMNNNNHVADEVHSKGDSKDAQPEVVKSWFDFDKLLKLYGVMLGVSPMTIFAKAHKFASGEQSAFLDKDGHVSFYQAPYSNVINSFSITRDAEFPPEDQFEHAFLLKWGCIYHDYVDTIIKSGLQMVDNIVWQDDYGLDLELLCLTKSPDEKYIAAFLFHEDNAITPGLYSLDILQYECPICNAKDIQIIHNRNVYHGGFYLCEHCGHAWGLTGGIIEKENATEIESYNSVCPHCHSENTYNDGSGYLQHKCFECGHVWGDDDTDDAIANLFRYDEIVLGVTHMCELDSCDYDTEQMDGYELSTGEYKGIICQEHDDEGISNISIYEESGCLNNFHKKLGFSFYDMSPDVFCDIVSKLGFEYKRCSETEIWAMSPYNCQMGSELVIVADFKMDDDLEDIVVEKLEFSIDKIDYYNRFIK